ncbi:MAG TPA: tetratricopeptide repeat protein [Candidatus Baltobacteraceae bacterium]|nr:tetratricopeptide repeat protein [Candidatus Baltobacteraceae bacterium]
MIRSIRIAAGAAAVAAAAAFVLPANAQYASEYIPAKLVRQGSTSKPIAGSGTVVVQVQVNPNGSHRVVKIIRSTNSADNAAAMDIAANSTYRPAHRGKTPIAAFYDFTLKFKGRSVAQQSGESVVKGSAAARIDALIHQGKYNVAKSQLQEALERNPNDAVLNEELGTVNYFLADYPSAAAAFEKVPTVSKTFAQVAAQSYALAAVKSASAAPQQAVAYGKKAVALLPSANTYYALGSAELAANDAAGAVTDLNKAFTLVQADPKADTKTKVAIASQLYQAYSKAGDNASAQKTLATIKQLDPTNTSVGTLEGNQYLQAGNTAAQAGNHAEALKDFEQAASVGSPAVQVTAYAAAALQQSALLQSQKSPATKDDYAKVKAYADKALAINPNDALANFAEGIGLAGEWVVGGKSDATLKAQALAALNKAKASAQSSGNISLSLNIDNFIKSTLQ